VCKLLPQRRLQANLNQKDSRVNGIKNKGRVLNMGRYGAECGAI
jgi:hypothetical protein